MNEYSLHIDKFLLPGEFYITRVPARIVTILGSCISIILFSSKHNISGIMHGMFSLDYAKQQVNNSNTIEYLFLQLLLKIKSYGLKNNELCAKIFGGSMINNYTYDPYNLSSTLLNGNQNNSAASMNIKAAFRIIEKEKIPIVAKDVGGTQARKIILESMSNDVYLKYLHESYIISYQNYLASEIIQGNRK